MQKKAKKKTEIDNNVRKSKYKLMQKKEIYNNTKKGKQTINQKKGNRQ